ncbi:hypothetical protein O181_117948 [Austropuccinia psidii MF-1]|uniref:Uncharacterized protein n=1 Tax=Austropuccinia psidii MF-1 TaxID=1389203 RepID=A0A9Q3KB64_9BASI|nr:hypothetical protein [Austropuccinia psidii MF-1]
MFIFRRAGSGYHGSHNRWKDIEENHTHNAIHPPIKWEPQTRGLEGYKSSSSAPQTPPIFIQMEHGQQEVQPSIKLGRTWSTFPEDMSQRDTLQRSYDNKKRMESQQAV